METRVGEIDRPSKAGPDEPINPAQVIARACEAISSGDVAAAASIIASDYPHTLLKHERRRKTIPAAVMIRVFLRDRFVDRYTGQQLIFGPALHLLSQILPDTFPAAQNWKMSGTHRGFYELFATVDHVLAQIHGGTAEPENLVTTSMTNNMKKRDAPIDGQRWVLRPPEPDRQWDGLVGWFLDRGDADPPLLSTPYLRAWHIVAKAVLTGFVEPRSAVARRAADTKRTTGVASSAAQKAAKTKRDNAVQQKDRANTLL
jgi:hypothetical protein